jgi:hypothetical protein
MARPSTSWPSTPARSGVGDEGAAALIAVLAATVAALALLLGFGDTGLVLLSAGVGAVLLWRGLRRQGLLSRT